jgi:hypothetical protein
VLSTSAADHVLEFVQSRYDREDELTKLAITECLRKIGTEYSLRFLLQKLEDTEGLLAWETVKSVSELKEKLGVRILSGEKLNQAIISTLEQGELNHKLAAFRILPSIETKELMISALKLTNGSSEIDDSMKARLFEKPKLFYEAAAELFASGGIEKKAVLMLLMDFWYSAEEEILKFRAWEGRMTIINSLVSCIESPDEEQRITALELLFRIDNTNSVYFMEEFTEDPSIWNRMKVLDMLDKISHLKADKILSRFASDEEEMINNKAKSIMEKRNLPTMSGDVRN